jgi:hypothetical protein
MSKSSYQVNNNFNVITNSENIEEYKENSNVAKYIESDDTSHKENILQNKRINKRNINLSSKQPKAKTKSTSTISKNHEDKKALIEGAANFPPIADAIRQEQIWKELRKDFYPDIGATPEEEKAIFLDSLDKVTKGLEGQEKSKAVLLHVLERFKVTGFTYRLDKDTEGVHDVASSVAETLADKGQGIDCEDFSIIADFWMKAAIEKGYLPEGSKSYMLYGQKHAVAVYQSPEGDSYIMDGTMGCERLLTYNQYREVSDYLALLEGEYKYAPYEKHKNKLVRWVSKERLQHESDSPLDKSISNMDLKKKIYARHGVAPDPSSPAQSIHDYYDSLLQYTHIEFSENKFEYTIANPMAVLPNAGSAIAEGTVATAFALYKRHKINRRRNNIIAAYNVKTTVEKHQTAYTNKTMNFAQFKNFSHVSFLVDNNDNKQIIPLAQILTCHKSYQTKDSLSTLVENLIKIFPNDTDLNNLEKDITEENIANPKKLLTIKEKLKKYGIAIEHQKLGSLKQQIGDKFRKQKNEKSQACMHKIVIDKKIFYKQLKSMNKLPKAQVIVDIVNNNNDTINTLHKLKNYDNWKLNFLTKDSAIKISAATTGFIPIIPVDELLRSGAYHLEEKYRMRNKANIQYRIKASLNILEQQKAEFTDEEHENLLSHLNNVQKVKTRHIELKENKVRIMQAIHIAAAVATPVTDVAGPMATGARSAAKGVAKVANSVYSMVLRYQGDKKQKQQQAFNTPIDVYKLYKNLYIAAKENNNIKKQNAILKLVSESFDLELDEFEALANTSVIENKQFKLSFSRPAGYQARVPYYLYQTKDIDETKL